MSLDEPPSITHQDLGREWARGFRHGEISMKALAVQAVAGADTVDAALDALRAIEVPKLA